MSHSRAAATDRHCLVPPLHQGHWYFPLSIAIMDVALAIGAARLCREWAALQAAVPAPRIIEVDDGILNYALGMPTPSGFLFAIDAKGYQAYREGRFLAEAAKRGYQPIGSLYYLRNASAAEPTPERIPDTLRARLFNATEWDLDRFDFAPAYKDDATGTVFIRFTPKR